MSINIYYYISKCDKNAFKTPTLVQISALQLMQQQAEFIKLLVRLKHQLCIKSWRSKQILGIWNQTGLMSLNNVINSLGWWKDEFQILNKREITFTHSDQWKTKLKVYRRLETFGTFGGFVFWQTQTNISKSSLCLFKERYTDHFLLCQMTILKLWP